MCTQGYYKARGFTVVELMLVVAILAILVGVGLPSFSNSVKDKRISSITSEFISAVYVARNEALTRRAVVTLDQNPAGWQAGWSINREGAELHAFTNATPDISLQLVGVGNTPLSIARFSFKPSGQVTNDASNTIGSISVLICDDRSNERGRTLTISPFGNVQNAAHADATTCNP